MRRLILLIFFSALYCATAFPQNRGKDEKLLEIISHYGQADVTVPFTGSKNLEELSRNVSVNSVREGVVNISLSRVTVKWFLSRNPEYTLLDIPDYKALISYPGAGKFFTWNTYPTFTQYDSIMRGLTHDFPSLCRLDTIGISVLGKPVLALKISDNPDLDETESEVFYTSTMHGNETGGFILMLRLADMLIRDYEGEERIRNLVDNLEIWINPLANPDGTYNTGDAITAPVRFNANGIDLNRNFPDPLLSGVTREKETLDMMRFMENHSFVLSANFHSGSEVVNYPWDRWLSKHHPDEEWFHDISRAYADTVHEHSLPGYMDDLDNGVTRGAEWYIIYGGRQDYVTYELQGREVTIELDDNFVTPSAELDALWESNRLSLLGYLENALYGIHGNVTDALTSGPLSAGIFIAGHDSDSSQVYTDKVNGNFVRLLAPGIWPLTFRADGYRDTTISVEVSTGVRTDIAMKMEKQDEKPDTTLAEPPVLFPNPVKTIIYALLPEQVLGEVTVTIFNDQGRLFYYEVVEATGDTPVEIDVSRFASGTYSAMFSNTKKNKACRGRFIVLK